MQSKRPRQLCNIREGQQGHQRVLKPESPVRGALSPSGLGHHAQSLAGSSRRGRAALVRTQERFRRQQVGLGPPRSLRLGGLGDRPSRPPQGWSVLLLLCQMKTVVPGYSHGLKGTSAPCGLSSSWGEAGPSPFSVNTPGMRMAAPVPPGL